MDPPSGDLGLELVGRLASFLPAYLKAKEYEQSSGFSRFFQSEPIEEKINGDHTGSLFRFKR
ncbi:hypothetical protein V8V91_20830 [Algoriphagus halophilus]|uniref:hypothetical protein n=1 Tax=Algoriphagus halophilus TaxID=226505 RepID=UPI00358E15CB